jgi:hypothetical protein
MKNSIVILFIVGITFFACKKDRTCTCTITNKGTSTTTGKVSIELIPGLSAPLADTSFTSPVYTRHVIDKKIIKSSKRVAKANCASYTEPYVETIPTSVPASSFNLSIIVTNEGVREYDCELK